ncbi:MAG TPA: DUF2139 domain-containing protein [Nitrososphaerales archaeon]|nr:DUF2139 domain-containing protein [Nitrososphaerales archaeon]
MLIPLRGSQYTFAPRLGPEWGSGGIFGLKHQRGVLFYDLAFEAEAHFVTKEADQAYPFDLVGGAPRSGGDTYNAVEAVDDQIYFGGWVHSPAVYNGRRNAGGTISFRNKFSHLHAYDIKEQEVRLLWSDSIRNETEWAGEVSEIVHDPLSDRLVFARGDGHANLGVFAADRQKGTVERLSELPSLKGTHFLDYMCFDVKKDWTKGMEAIQTLDLVTGKWSVTPLDYGLISVDGGSVRSPLPGCATSAYSNLFFFVHGGVVVGDPVDAPNEMRFLRLLDFKTPYAPTRTMAKSVLGGVMVAFNAYSHGSRRPGSGPDSSPIAGPSVLLYATPPQLRIVGAFGARITGFEKVGGELLVAASNEANLGSGDATPIDTGYRDLAALDLGGLIGASPPVTFHGLGSQVGAEVWGGVPLDGYSSAELLCDVTSSNKITINEYRLSLPVVSARHEVSELRPGRNRLDLSSFHGIVSFRLERADAASDFWVTLK